MLDLFVITLLAIHIRLFNQGDAWSLWSNPEWVGHCWFHVLTDCVVALARQATQAWAKVHTQIKSRISAMYEHRSFVHGTYLKWPQQLCIISAVCEQPALYVNVSSCVKPEKKDFLCVVQSFTCSMSSSAHGRLHLRKIFVLTLLVAATSTQVHTMLSH